MAAGLVICTPVDREGEGLGGVRMAPFVAVIVNGYVPPVARRRCSRKSRRAVPVVVERDSRRQAARRTIRRGRPGRGDGKGPGLADGEGGAGRLAIWHAWLTVRVKDWVARSDTVRRGDRERVCSAGARSRCSRKCRRAVLVVGELWLPSAGRPFSDNRQMGYPVVVTVKVPGWPTVKVVPLELVIWHAAG